MSNMENNCCLQAIKNKTVSDIASEIFQGTFVESAYDLKGKFSYLLARLSKNEFVRLYSPLTTASVFIQGFWLQLNLQSSKKRVLNRETKTELTLEVGVNEYGVSEVSFFRLNRCVSKFRFKNISAKDLLTTENGFHYIARVAAKTFQKIAEQSNYNSFFCSHLPVIVVLATEEYKRSSDFNVRRVLLQ